MGVVASIVGLFLGLALAKGLFSLFDAVGFTLPNNGLLFETRTIVVSLALGIVVTLIASFFPALRATRVPPIAAVREGAELPPGRFARFRTPVAAVLTALGFALLVLGLFSHGTSTVLILLIVGTLLVFVGVAMLSAPLIPALVGVPRLAGDADRRRRRVAGARQRAPEPAAHRVDRGGADDRARARDARRDARGRASRRRSAARSNDIFVGDYAITAQNNFSPIPISVGEAAAKAPGVTAVGSVRTGDALVFGETIFTTAVTPGSEGRDHARLEGGLAGRDRDARRRRRVRRRRLRGGPRPRRSARRSRSRSSPARRRRSR